MSNSSMGDTTLLYPDSDPYTEPHARQPTYHPGPSPAQLARQVEQELIEGFRETLKSETHRATFTCGGSLPILLEPNRDESGELTPRTGKRVQEQRSLTKPVTVRWGPDGSGRVLSLPPINNEGQAKLEQLVQDCKPATFGRGGEDVYDEAYRCAVAMGVADFMTDFCPYESGIIDIVTQLLLPSITGDLRPLPGDDKSLPPRSKVAEKYDLAHAQEAEIHYAILKLTRQNGKYINSGDIQRCLEGMRLLPQDTKEMLEIMGKLDPTGTGLTLKEDFMEVAARRMQAGKKTEGPNDKMRRLMSRGIRAELYKLNIYSGPSGFFKPHVDTPRSEAQIGSLLVCLPVDFEGGGLSVRHHGQDVVHEWSGSKCSAQAPALQWAAFYSDCEHEVYQVTSGHRMTLTYNLFLASGTGLLAGRSKSLEPNSLPLALSIKELLASSTFMASGGYLGVHLAHSYPHTHPKQHQFVPSMLKGVDMALYEAVGALGLSAVLDQVTMTNLPSVGIKQTFEALDDQSRSQQDQNPRASMLKEVDIRTNYLDQYGDKYEDDSDVMRDAIEEWYGYHPPEGTESDWDLYPDEMVPDNVRMSKQRVDVREKTLWLNEPRHKEMSRAYMAYGNEAELRVTYSSAVLVVKVPRWLERNVEGTERDLAVLVK